MIRHYRINNKILCLTMSYTIIPPILCGFQPSQPTSNKVFVRHINASIDDTNLDASSSYLEETREFCVRVSDFVFEQFEYCFFNGTYSNLPGLVCLDHLNAIRNLLAVL